MKKQSNVTRTASPSVKSLGAGNMVPAHGKSSPAKGGANYGKTTNTIGVTGKAKG